MVLPMAVCPAWRDPLGPADDGTIDLGLVGMDLRDVPGSATKEIQGVTEGSRLHPGLTLIFIATCA